VAVGEGRINTETGFVSPMPVGVGDGVCFGKFTGEEVTYNGANHHLIRDDDILVKFPAGTERTLENAEVIWDSVLVKVEKKKVEESGGILIAKTVKKAFKSSVGEVLKVGPGRYAFNGVLMENDVSPGDMVKFRDFAAQEVEIDGMEYSVVKMIDLLAKF
jgi:chaperonin GroES